MHNIPNIRNKMYQNMLVTTLKTPTHTIQTQTPPKKKTFHEQKKQTSSVKTQSPGKSKGWNVKNNPQSKGEKSEPQTSFFYRGLEVAFRMVPTDSSEFWRWLCHPVLLKAGFSGEVSILGGYISQLLVVISKWLVTRNFTCLGNKQA